MKRIRITIAILIALAVVALQQGLMTTMATAGIADPCSSTVETWGPGSGVLLACPAGDGAPIEDGAGVILVCVRDGAGTPIAGVLASDIWLVDVYDDLSLCGGSSSSSADSMTNSLGYTTISTGTLAAGGCALNGLSVVVQGVVITDEWVPFCDDPVFLPFIVPSVDLNGDLSVGIADLSVFSAAWPPAVIDWCVDLDGDAEIGLRDFAYMLLHFNHQCD